MDTLESQLLLKSVRKSIVLASFDHTFIHSKPLLLSLLFGKQKQVQLMEAPFPLHKKLSLP